MPVPFVSSRIMATFAEKEMPDIKYDRNAEDTSDIEYDM